MKLALSTLFFCASSTFAADSTEIVWTSDTTYVKGGVEYWDPIESARKIVSEWLNDEETGTGNLYDVYEGEFNMNPMNSPRNDMWMYCYTDLC